MSCDIETNPGPAQKIQKFYGYPKVSLLKDYITAHKMDIICLSETYLDSSIQSDNDNLEIP